MAELPRKSASVMLVVTALLFALVAMGYWSLSGRPIDIGKAAADQVQCMSYAPFRKPGESPFIVDAWVDEARLREDLTLLSSRTDCVRTYSVQQGLEAVPRIAQSLGMKVLLGVWLGRNRTENEAEMDKGIGLARAFPGTVEALIVGNEVLLRRELSEAVLATYIDRARAEASVPVTYADVWEFWSKHRSLASHVSFVTIHILPYWEDEPVAIDQAIEHIVDTAQEMRRLFEGKEILIGETGWPSAGRARRGAVAGRVNQALFFRRFSVAAREHGFRYNVIEAFDQPWKRRLEGAMGGNWGLFDSDGMAKFPAAGPIAENPHWRNGLIGAAIGAVLCAGFAYRRGLRGLPLLASLLTGLATGAFAIAQWQYMVVWNRYGFEWGATLLYSILSVIFPLIAVMVAASAVRPGLQQPAASWEVVGVVPARPALTPFFKVVRRWRDVGGGWTALARLTGLDWLGVLRFLFLFGSAAMTLLLVFDSRYRGFPVWLYAPALLALLLVAAGGIRADRFGVEEAVLATITLGCVLAFVPIERWSNPQSLVFGAQMVLLAGAATGFRFWRVRLVDRS